jgi:signal transduction histidine kinase
MTKASLLSRGARRNLSVAMMLVAVIPILSLAFLTCTDAWVWGRHAVAWVPPVVTLLAGCLAFLGYLMLRRYPRNLVRLRGYLESITAGQIPEHVELESAEDDIRAVERVMNTLLGQLRDQIRSLEEQLAAARRMQAAMQAQAEELMQAERQRVMIESVGAACHHIGQPATVLRVNLEFLRQERKSPADTARIVECEQAMDAIADILDKLRRVSSYRTVPYRTFADGADAADARILDIEF